MARQQHKAPVAKTAKNPVEPPVEADSPSSDEDLTLDDVEEEFHSEDESEEDDNAPAVGEDASAEFHTASEDGSEDEGGTENIRGAPLLPTELLKSKPTITPAPVKISWDQLNHKEKKALRDEMGISMRELRTQVQGTGVLEAGIAAQVKRGILPADKVAGSRITKKRKRKGGEPKVEMSEKQKLIEGRRRRALLNARGSVLPVKKKKRKG